MARKGVSKIEIISGINALLETGKVPTAASVRDYLGRGSLTTIQKYFRGWKLDSFKNNTEEKKSLFSMPVLTSQENIEELRSFQKRVIQLEEQNKAISHELMIKEQESLKLNKENIALNQNLDELADKYKYLSLKFEDCLSSYNDLKNERETTLQKILDDKNLQVERLSLELKEIHRVHLNMIRDVGRNGDDLILDEKVKNIHLTDKIKELQIEVQTLKSGTEQAEKIKAPLQREIKRQRALIQQFFTWEQLKDFENQPSGEG